MTWLPIAHVERALDADGTLAEPDSARCMDGFFSEFLWYARALHAACVVAPALER